MTYQDKFKVGDKVTWRNDGYATVTGGREKLGDGPFQITQVRDIDESAEYDPYDHQYMGQQSAGHTQHVVIAESPTVTFTTGRTAPRYFSGAYFKLA